MGRNRFVQGGVVRLQLADVHKRAHEALVAKGVETEKGKFRPATAEEIAASAERVHAAVEDGAWIDVKRELTSGEARHAFARLVKTMRFNERAEVDPVQVGLAKVTQYMIGWSLTDADGPVPYSEDALANVDQATYGEIEAAIDWHEDQVIAAREARKNDQGDETRSSATSSSVA